MGRWMGCRMGREMDRQGVAGGCRGEREDAGSIGNWVALGAGQPAGGLPQGSGRKSLGPQGLQVLTDTGDSALTLAFIQEAAKTNQ